MNYRQLIKKSRSHPCPGVGMNPGIAVSPATVFSVGARWMYNRLGELRPGDVGPFDENVRYTVYGLLKYLTSLTGAALAAVVMSTYGLIAIPAAVLAFYLFEIHFLFLFPLLIDRAPRPLLTSIRATYKIGVWRCLITVIPIAGYMLAGLFRKTDRLGNWYTGCLSILIWYDHEIRNRL